MKKDRRYNPRDVKDVENADRTGKMKPVDGGEIQSIVTRSIERAVKHYKEHLEPDQKEATDYYHGRPFGDEQDGRSKVVSTDLRDTVLAVMPSLLDVFFGAERAVEYAPWGPEDVEMAEQATDYVNHVVIGQDNRGYVTYQAWFQDAFVRNLGIVKVWWDKSCRIESSTHTGLDEAAVIVLTNDPTVTDWEFLEVRGTEAGETYDVRVTRKRDGGRARFEAIPSEEFVFTPNARSLEFAPLVAHVREAPREELVQLGIDEKLIDDAMGKQAESENPAGVWGARRQDDGADALSDDDTEDPSQRKVLFAEVYALVDGDGDGVAERRKFWCVGPNYEIANGKGKGEVVDDEVSFIDITPFLEAHTVVGLGFHDLTKDIQRVKSQVLRATLNSLALAVEPKTEVVSGEVNMKDLLSPDIQGIVRVTRPGMMREIGHEFVGPSTLPMLEHYDRIKEDRTRITRAASGLDPDSLQSSTKAAVAATVSASQASQKFLARTIAETGVRRLFKALLRLVIRHQDQPRMIRLRGKWVQIDPRHWNAEMDVVVSVGLGQGTAEDRLATLQAIIADQNQLMQAGSPLVGWSQMRASRAKAVELAGFRNAEEFYKPFGPQEEQQFAQAQQQNQPPPDPAMAMVQLEGEKAKAQHGLEQAKAQNAAQMDAAKLQFEREKAQSEMEFKREVAFRELALKEADIEAKNRVNVIAEGMSAHVEHAKNQMGAVVAHKQADLEHERALMQPEPTDSEAE